MKNVILAVVFLMTLINTYFSFTVSKEIKIVNKYQQEQNHKIELMQKALEMSDNLLDSHNIWDIDGSDYMSDYLVIRQEIDSTFLSGFDK